MKLYFELSVSSYYDTGCRESLVLHGQLVPSYSLAAQLPPSIQCSGAAVIPSFSGAGTASDQTVTSRRLSPATISSKAKLCQVPVNIKGTDSKETKSEFHSNRYQANRCSDHRHRRLKTTY
ncbi:hypothetical protein EK904_009508 [Melospiza melodia maxima]|nr:hypothetical protein EK904_009508 [Melospiza melodia maxima]